MSIRLNSSGSSVWETSFIRFRSEAFLCLAKTFSSSDFVLRTLIPLKNTCVTIGCQKQRISGSSGDPVYPAHAQWVYPLRSSAWIAPPLQFCLLLRLPTWHHWPSRHYFTSFVLQIVLSLCPINHTCTRLCQGYFRGGSRVWTLGSSLATISELGIVWFRIERWSSYSRSSSW